MFSLELYILIYEQKCWLLTAKNHIKGKQRFELTKGNLNLMKYSLVLLAALFNLNLKIYMYLRSEFNIY